MESLALALIISICFLAIYTAAFATYYVAQSELFERHQQYAIYAIAWLLPIIGPAIIISIVWPEIRATRKSGIPLIGYLFLAYVISESEETSGNSAGGGNHFGGNADRIDDL